MRSINIVIKPYSLEYNVLILLWMFQIHHALLFYHMRIDQKICST